jgi:hypothetical protein
VFESNIPPLSSQNPDSQMIELLKNHQVHGSNVGDEQNLASIILVAGLNNDDMVQLEYKHRENFVDYLEPNCTAIAPQGKSYFSLEPGQKYKLDMEKACAGRRAFITKTGFVGLEPPCMQVGDVVGVLYGSRAPLILRRNEVHYWLIGEAYVHGIMRSFEVSKMIAAGKLEQEVFELR